MKHFSLFPFKTAMRGVFYPTGHMVLMFPTEQDARHACELLKKDGVSEEEMSLATPQEFESQITGATEEDSDWVLPSVGTEGETAQHFRQLAHEGHYALFVHAGARVNSQHVIDADRERIFLADIPTVFGDDREAIRIWVLAESDVRAASSDIGEHGR